MSQPEQTPSQKEISSTPQIPWEDSYGGRLRPFTDTEKERHAAELALCLSQFRAQWNNTSRELLASGQNANFRGADGTHLTMLASQPLEQASQTMPQAYKLHNNQLDIAQ